MPKAVKDWPLGRKIVEVRPMTKEEMEEEGWSQGCAVLVLDDGSTIYPSGDDEGNHPGTLFGANGDKKMYILAGGTR